MEVQYFYKIDDKIHIIYKHQVTKAEIMIAEQIILNMRLPEILEHHKKQIIKHHKEYFSLDDNDNILQKNIKFIKFVKFNPNELVDNENPYWNNETTIKEYLEFYGIKGLQSNKCCFLYKFIE